VQGHLGVLKQENAKLQVGDLSCPSKLYPKHKAVTTKIRAKLDILLK